jgi:CelD/BcsL family acetyltransferase involved in cellulose biosynthesis
MSSYTVAVVEDIGAFSCMAEEWNQLLEVAEAKTFFLAWEWLYSWAECFLNDKRRLFIITFREDATLVGIAPFYVDIKQTGPFPLRELRFLGSPESGSDYLDVIARKGHEKSVADALHEHLMGACNKAWNQAALGEMKANSLFLLHFVNKLETEGKHFKLERSAYCPNMQLPAAFADIYPMLSPSWRKKFKQDQRVIAKEQQVAYDMVRGEKCKERLQEFFRFYNEKSGWKNGTLPAFITSLMNNYGSQSPVQLDFLKIDGAVVAALLHFEYGATLSMYLMAVDKGYNPKVSAGNLLVGKAIENAIEAGLTMYDFLKGDERYKFHWATGGVCTLKLTFWRRSPAAFISTFTSFFRDAGKVLLR